MLNECPTTIYFDVYQPRNPKASAYYRCVKDHFEQLEMPIHNWSFSIHPLWKSNVLSFRTCLHVRTEKAPAHYY